MNTVAKPSASAPLAPRAPRTWLAPLALLLLVATALPWLPVPDLWITQANYIGLYALVVIGLVLLTGIAGLTSFGQAAFVGIGAYTTAYLTLRLGWSPWATLLAGLGITGFSAWVIGAITMRMSGHYLPLATIAWSIALYYLFGSLDALGKYDGLSDLPSVDLFGWRLAGARPMYGLIWLSVALATWGGLNLLNSQPGRAVRTLKGGTAMAEAMGVNTERLKVTVFVIAALLASVSGWLFAHLQRAVNPTPFGLEASLKYVIMLVAGGMSHIWGALLGSTVITVLQDQLQVLLPRLLGSSGNFEIIVFGALLVLLLRFAPGGIWPWLRRLAPPLPPVADKLLTRPAASLPRRSAAPAGTPLLEVRGIQKRFGGLVAVDGVALTVKAGEIVGLIGPNGAGKSTTFNLVTGVLAPSAGEVLYRGERIDGLPPRTITGRGMARTFQHVKLVDDMSVLENVAIGGYLRASSGVVSAVLRRDRPIEAALLQEAERALQRVGLGELMLRPAGSLALGQQRLVEIARALCCDPALLLLDEPAAGLRAFEKQALAKLLGELRAEGMGILLVEHDMEFLMKLTDHIVVMVFGRKIAEGTPGEIQTHPAVLEAYLGATP